MELEQGVCGLAGLLDSVAEGEAEILLDQRGVEPKFYGIGRVHCWRWLPGVALGYHRSIFVDVCLQADVIQPSAVGLVPLDGFSDAFLK